MPEPTGTNSYYSKYGKEKKLTNELDFCVGTGWGIGYQLRREFNPYVGWNIFGISYLALSYDPTDEGILKINVLGVRGNTPSYKWFRGYADLSVGYSLGYHTYYWRSQSTTIYHSFGIDNSIGIQVYKNISFGCNLVFNLEGDGILGAKLSYLF